MAEENTGTKKGSMSVSEAGRKGGVTVAQERGRAFYEQIGHKGGQKVRELIEQGKRMAREAGKKERGGLDEMGNLTGRGEE